MTTDLIRRRSSIAARLSGKVEFEQVHAAEPVVMAEKDEGVRLRLTKSDTLQGRLVRRLTVRRKAGGATPEKSFSGSSFQSLFLRLPSELHELILNHLPLSDILILRTTSRTFYNIVCDSEAAISRNLIRKKLDPLHLCLYPPPAAREISLTYLINIEHRKITTYRLAAQLSNFVAREILRCDTSNKRRAFRTTWLRMFDKLVPLLFTLNHFFESYRASILTRALGQDDSSATSPTKFCITTGSTVWDEQARIMERYEPLLLLECYHMYGFMLQAFERKLRPPSYASRIEKLLRGWTAKPATSHQIEILLMLGGMDMVQKVLSKRTYNERRRALDAFIRDLSPQLNPQWRQHWRALGVEQAGVDLDKIPQSRIAVPPLPIIWVPSALKLLLEKGVIDDVEFGDHSPGRSTRNFVSGLVGYDILRFSSPPAYVPGDSDDEDESDLGESDSEEEDSDDDSDASP